MSAPISVAKSPPDGYTLLMHSSAMASASSLYGKLPFDPVKDFVPVTMVISTQFVIGGSPKNPATNLKELVALAKDKPGAYNYGSSGPGSSLHLFAEMFSSIAGVKLVHIPYRGDAPMITALIANDIQLAFLPQANGIANVQSNLIRGLGVTGTKRHAGDPRRADRAGTGLQGSRGRKLGVAVRAGRHAARRREDHPGVCRQGAGRSAGARTWLASTGQEPVGNSPAEFAASTRRTSRATPRSIEAGEDSKAGIVRMQSPLRRFSACAALVIAACTLAGPALAQNFPNRPVRIIVPFAAGGAVDTVGRIVAAKMTELLGQAVIVENRTGAGGNIAADLVAKSPPDGYTLLLTTSGHAITPALYRTVSYDAVKDFTPVSQVLATTFVLVATPKLPAHSVAEVVALAKSKPGGLNYGSSGLGAPLHLAMEVFKHSAGIDVVHIPYRGDAPVNAALTTGEIQLAVVPQSTGLPFITNGSIRALGVTGTKRSPVLPDVPTIAEAGVTGLETRSWNGLFAPAGTPREIVVTLQKAVAASMASADVRDKVFKMGQDPIGGTPEEFDALFKSDLARFARIIEQAKIQRID